MHVLYKNLRFMYTFLASMCLVKWRSTADESVCVVVQCLLFFWIQAHLQIIFKVLKSVRFNVHVYMKWSQKDCQHV